MQLIRVYEDGERKDRWDIETHDDIMAGSLYIHDLEAIYAVAEILHRELSQYAVFRNYYMVGWNMDIKLGVPLVNWKELKVMCVQTLNDWKKHEY